MFHTYYWFCIYLWVKKQKQKYIFLNIGIFLTYIGKKRKRRDLPDPENIQPHEIAGGERYYCKKYFFRARKISWKQSLIFVLNSHHTTFVKLCGLVVNIHLCKKKANAINTIDTRQYSCYIAADQYNCKKMVLGSIFYYFLTCHFLLVLLGSYPKKFYTLYHFF